MLGSTHILGGLVFGFLFDVPGYAMPFAVIGSVFPDIDLTFSRLIPEKGKKKTLLSTHRGFTHHPLAVLALFFLWLYLEKTFPQYHFYWQFLYGFWVGYLSHLVLDMLTPLGIPVGLSYYPRLKIGIMSTGGTGEKFFRFLLAFAFIGIVYLKSVGVI